MNDNIIYKLRRKLQTIAYDLTSPEFMSKLYYRIILKDKLNLENPQTLNEKLQWLKLYEWPQNDLAIKCTDKFEVREFIQQQGLGKYLNELYYVWDSVEEIDWDILPEQFVLKCTHGCHYNIICPNKNELNIKKTQSNLHKWMSEDFSKYNAEPHYSKIKPRIICEKFLDNEFTDYKFFCFNGNVEFMYIIEYGTEDYITIFNINAEKLPYKRAEFKENSNVTIPDNFQQMVQLSKQLAKSFPFVRVDWFSNKDKIYFGELTFTPSSALMKYEPKEYDIILGDKLDISELKDKYLK